MAINQTKLTFKLDEQGHPISFAPYITKDSNHLVEEFMLLANMRVAEKIAKCFPDSALLRRHPTPVLRKAQEFAAFCQATRLGEVDLSSASSLAQSLEVCKSM